MTRWHGMVGWIVSVRRSVCRWRPISPVQRSNGCWIRYPACARLPSRAMPSSATSTTWLIWWLTGGPQGGSHVTDVTNASRTLLMDLKTLDWDAGDIEGAGHPPPDAAAHRAIRRPKNLGRPPKSAVHSRTSFRSPAIWETSRPPWSVRPASSRVKPRIPMAPAVSCCSIPARHRSVQKRAADHPRLPLRRYSRQSMRWRARSPSPVRWCSGCAITSD